MGMDSVILTGLMSISCGNIQGQDNLREACSSGLEAAARQSGVYEEIKKEEKKLTEKAEDKIRENFDTNTLEVMSATILAGRLALGYNSSFRFKGGPFKATYVFETNTKSFFLRIGWDL